MHLINARTRKLESFAGSRVPAYAILSHTWGEEEVSFQDLTTDVNVDLRKGYAKIRYTCHQAIRDGLEYCWVDTCCIDKTSSAELSEAINSMFPWYQRARVCYAYLSDVTGGWPWLLSTFRVPNKDIDEDAGLAYLAASRWFTRGWTLQELIAPRNVIFFDRNWQLLGSRASLDRELHQITRIDSEVLRDPESLWAISVAKRLSWAAHRETIRREDEAYCLLGIFNINMPLLYGEGDKAFLRLQEAIIRETTDHTIFAWDFGGKVTVDLNNLNRERNERQNTQGGGYIDDKLGVICRNHPDRKPPDHILARKGLKNIQARFGGELLAPSVQYFANAGAISRSTSVTSPRSHEVTSVGLRITLPVIDAGNGQFLAILQCHQDWRQVALGLRDPTYRWGQNLKPSKTKIFEFDTSEVPSRLKHVLPRGATLEKEREILILKPRQKKNEVLRENPNTMFVHFREGDQLRPETLWPASYWDVTGWRTRVHVPERDDVRIVKYTAPSTGLDAVSGVGGLAIRDTESDTIVHLCFNCRRGQMRGIPALHFHTGTEDTLQDRCRAMEKNYINSLSDYKGAYNRYTLYSYIDESSRLPNLAFNGSSISNPIWQQDQQLLEWLKQDDELQTSLYEVTAKITIGSKQIVATMSSEVIEGGSHVVLRIIARNGWEKLNMGWEKLNILNPQRSSSKATAHDVHDPLWVRAIEIFADIIRPR